MPEPASCDKTQQKLWLAKSDGVSMRSNRKMILISTIWCFLIPITGCLAQKSAPGTAVAFQLYLLQKDSLPIPKRISALNAILDKDDQFAQAHAELARLLVSTGGRKNRIEALVAIERAISLQPKNAEFHYLAPFISSVISTRTAPSLPAKHSNMHLNSIQVAVRRTTSSDCLPNKPISRPATLQHYIQIGAFHFCHLR